jgi:hypothetical protein
MSKTAIIIAIFFPSAAFAAMPVLAPSTQTQQPEQSQSASVIGTHGARVSDQLSMGPDPGGKTGATVTPDTTKTGQPSHDGTGASNQSGATSTAAPRAASDRTDPGTRPTSGSETLKQQRDSSGKQPIGTTGTGPTSSSTSGRPGNDR